MIALMHPDHRTPAPFSFQCKRDQHDDCARLRRRCGCFCHPEGYGPNIDEGDLPVGLHPKRAECPHPGCLSSFADPGLLQFHVESAHPGWTPSDEPSAAATSDAGEGGGSHPMPATPPAPVDDERLAEVLPFQREEQPVADDKTPCPHGCGKTFKTLGRLNNHVIREHGQPDDQPHINEQLAKPTKPARKRTAKAKPEPPVGEVDEGVGYVVELEPYDGVTVRVLLVASSPKVAALAREAMDRYDIPYTLIQD